MSPRKLPVKLWDLLICTIPHRHATLCELLGDLDRQIRENNALGLVGAVLYRDNLTMSYGDKTQVLTWASVAEYVSCIDDDDLLAPDGVARVLAALEKKPDYVGFAIEWTRDGQLMQPVEHSLRHPRWVNGPDALLRSVMQFNPIRREYALDGTWEGGYGAERAWGDRVIAAGRVKSEVFIGPPPVYRYREHQGDTFRTERKPYPDVPPELPSYPWLVVLRGAPGAV